MNLLRFRLLACERLSEPADAARRWEGQVEEFQPTIFLQIISSNWWRTDWVREVYFPRTYVIENPPQDSDLEEENIESQNFEDQIILFSISMTLIGREEIQINVLKFRTSQELCEEIFAGALEFLSTWKWKETAWKLRESGKPQPTWCWNSSRNLDIQYPKSFSSVPWNLEEEEEQGDHAFHFGCFRHRPLYRTTHSANQISICGAVASWCEKFGVKFWWKASEDDKW